MFRLHEEIVFHEHVFHGESSLNHAAAVKVRKGKTLPLPFTPWKKSGNPLNDRGLLFFFDDR